MSGLSETAYLYSHEAEVSVLGSILMEPELIKDSPLKPEHFSPGRHHNLYYTLLDMDSKNIPIDFVSIVERTGSKIDKLGGVSYISQLTDTVPSTANFKHHCGILIEYHQRRKAFDIAKTLMETAKEGDPLEAIQSSVSSLMAVEDSGTDDDDGDIKEALVSMYASIENATGEVTGIPSGYEELDRMTGGFKGGDLIIVGARPSMGKTAYAINIGLNACATPENPGGDVTAIFSLEMSKEQLLKRAAAAIGRIDAQRMKFALERFKPEDWSSLITAMGYLSNSDFRIFDKAGINVNYIWSKLRKLKRQYPGRRMLVIIDYLQLIVGSKQHKGNRQAEISEISRTLKAMARELDVAVIALSQLSRGVEQRQDKHPMMSDLRESGQLEQDADIIQFLYRDDYYNAESEAQNIIEIIMAKQRDGPTGNVELAFVKEYGKFLNLDQRYS